jgi:hypothetical protein
MQYPASHIRVLPQRRSLPRDQLHNVPRSHLQVFPPRLCHSAPIDILQVLYQGIVIRCVAPGVHRRSDRTDAVPGRCEGLVVALRTWSAALVADEERGYDRDIQVRSTPVYMSCELNLCSFHCSPNSLAWLVGLFDASQPVRDAHSPTLPTHLPNSPTNSPTRAPEMTLCT